MRMIFSCCCIIIVIDHCPDFLFSAGFRLGKAAKGFANAIIAKAALNRKQSARFMFGA
jgi:hypothetical protein